MQDDKDMQDVGPGAQDDAPDMDVDVDSQEDAALQAVLDTITNKTGYDASAEPFDIDWARQLAVSVRALSAEQRVHVQETHKNEWVMMVATSFFDNGACGGSATWADFSWRAAAPNGQASGPRIGQSAKLEWWDLDGVAAARACSHCKEAGTRCEFLTAPSARWENRRIMISKKCRPCLAPKDLRGCGVVWELGAQDGEDEGEMSALTQEEDEEVDVETLSQEEQPPPPRERKAAVDDGQALSYAALGRFINRWAYKRSNGPIKHAELDHAWLGQLRARVERLSARDKDRFNGEWYILYAQLVFAAVGDRDGILLDGHKLKISTPSRKRRDTGLEGEPAAFLDAWDLKPREVEEKCGRCEEEGGRCEYVGVRSSGTRCRECVLSMHLVCEVPKVYVDPGARGSTLR